MTNLTSTASVPGWEEPPGRSTNEREGYARVIKLRLRRMGAKKRPSYRIVAAESRFPRDGRFIEAIGFYDPLTEPATITLKEDRIRHWLSNGAQPTDTVRDILRRHGLVADPRATEGDTTGDAATASTAV